MVKWFHLFKNQYFGFWTIGFVLFILQEMPYIVMPLIHLDSNPVMNMTESSVVLNALEKFLGISCVLILCFIVQENSVIFSFGEGVQKMAFILAIIVLLTNYFGWALYYNGHQSAWIILTFLVALPPLYYACIGFWRENWILFVFGIAFGLVHVAHVYGNLVR